MTSGEAISCPKMSISGDIGSGKSAVGRLLQEELGLPGYSTGSIQRRIAERHGMTTLELNRYSETHPEIDEEIDSASIELGKKDESFLIDSRIAWHFIPHSFKVFLAVATAIAAERILGDRGRTSESYDDVAVARERIVRRRRSEVERFGKTYGIDLSDLGNYDLVVDTSSSPPEDVAAVISRSFRAFSEGRPPGAGAFLPPPLLVPASSGRDTAEGSGVRAFHRGDFYFLVSGHQQVREALAEHAGLVAAELVPDDGGELDGYDLSRLREWEERHGLRFPACPDELATA